MGCKPWLAAVLLAAPLAAGCLGVEKEQVQLVSPREEVLAGHWHQTNHTGTATRGVDLLVDQVGGTNETLTVPNGTIALVLNVTAFDGDLDLCIDRPGEPNGTVAAQDPCDDRLSTRAGNTTWVVHSPPAGEWRVHLTPSSPARGATDYTLIMSHYVLDHEEVRHP